MLDRPIHYLFWQLVTGVIAVVADILNPDVTLDLIGPSNITEGDNVNFNCSSSYFHAGFDNFQWIHVTRENKINALIDNGRKSILDKYQFFETFSITQNCEPDDNFKCHSNLFILNITKTFDGWINCSQSQGKLFSSFRVKSRILPIEVQLSQSPVIYNATNANSSKITGQSVQWSCKVWGMPPPTIEWFKNGQPLLLPKDDKRVLLLDNNQTLKIYSSELEDIGTYECKASNRIGTAVSVNTLSLTDSVPPSGRENYIVPVILFCVLMVFLTAAMVYCFMYTKHKREWKDNAACKLHTVNGFVETRKPPSADGELRELLLYDEQWEFPRDKLILGKELGSGAFGVVFKAEAMDITEKGVTTTVAVKMVKPDTDPLYTKALASELKVMIDVGQHLNVVNLLGACMDGSIKKQLMVIVEFCRFGSIHQYLLDHREYFVNQITKEGYLDFNIKTISKIADYENVKTDGETHLYQNIDEQIDPTGYLIPDKCVGPSWRSNYCGDYMDITTMPLNTYDLLFWSYQISKGMEYLTSKKILHGDLATRNVLLSDENIVKICDFGFAKTLYDSDFYRKKSKKDRLPVKWMAVESLRDLVFSTQSDVWAFGITVWEIFSLAVTPYPTIRTFDELYKRILDGYRMEKPSNANAEIYAIMMDCWNDNPALRPSFTELSRRFGDLLEIYSTSNAIRLNKNYLRMTAKAPPPDDYENHSINPIYVSQSKLTSTETKGNSYQIMDESESSSEHIEHLESGLSVENSGYI